LEVFGEGCRRSPERWRVVFAAAAAAHVATVGARAGWRRGPVAAKGSKAVAVMGLSKLAKGWHKSAVKGNPEDQYRLARCYAEGLEGVKRDKVAAAAWYGKAAEQKHTSAQVDLGACYAEGEGVEQNHELAMTLYRKAADVGHALGQHDLGSCYARGEGVEQNDARAVAWWEKAAVNGNDRSQYMLGRCYMHGTHGVPKNARRARSFLKAAAAAQGHEAAIEFLKLLNTCESCGAPDANRTCGGCRPAKGICGVRYCTPECQTKDWKSHKLDCGGLKVCECRNCRVSERGESSTSAAPE